MNLKSLKLACVAMAAAIALNALPAGAAGTKSGHVLANGINYYYEISGQGEPLLLLHGGLGSTGMFAPVLPALTEHRTVIAIDLQGHGRTALGTREISLPALGDDVVYAADLQGRVHAIECDPHTCSG